MTGSEIKPLLDSIRDVLAIGMPKYQMVINEEIATALDANPNGAIDQGFSLLFMRDAIRHWKVWTLLNPRSFITYNLNNLSGDLDALIAGNPSALNANCLIECDAC